MARQVGDTPIRLSAAQLVPRSWRSGSSPVFTRAYNPSIVAWRGQVLMAYRVDSGRNASFLRRIAICRLDDSLALIPGSVIPFSDSLEGCGRWQYDPRFLVFKERLFIHFNNNYLTRPNRIFLAEVDPETLLPMAPAREVTLDAPRRDIEKNWMFFGNRDELFAVYSIQPHAVLRVDISGTGPIVCRPAFRNSWDDRDYARRFGEMRGGTPPILVGETYVSFFHSSRQENRLGELLQSMPLPPGLARIRILAALDRRIRWFLSKSIYFGGIYTFEAQPPFLPVASSSEPFLRPENEAPRRYRWRPNHRAAGVVFPCGLVPWENGQYLLSYGLHDESCRLRVLALPPPFPASGGR
jgi:hypothetical protein